MAYNLTSPNGLLEPCLLDELPKWFARELVQVSNEGIKHVLKHITNDLNSFVRWPQRAILLWPECDRVPPPGKKQKYFSYPPHLRDLAKTARVNLDTRPNGPAIAAFQLAGGERPARFGSTNAWSIHHLYSGKFPYVGRTGTTHAAKACEHFTQSAGLIAVHPIADALVDEFPFFTWLLRALAFKSFGYDPDAVFSTSSDEYGFAAGGSYQVITVPSASAGN